MAEQNYKNHARFVPMFHFVLFGLIVIAFVGSVAYLIRRIGDHHGRTILVLLVIITFAQLLQFFFSRTFPLKAQDRAIRAEENLRHHVLTGKLLDPRLSVLQIVGLRFASDEEFPALAQKAAESGMSNDEIKKSIKNWRADNYRV